MIKRLALIAAAIVTFSTGAFAQVGFSNAGVEIRYSSFNWDVAGSGSYSEYEIDGFAIFDLSSGFQVQVDGGYSHLYYQSTNNYDDTGYGIHGIYNFGASTRVGLFYTNYGLWETFDNEAFGLELQYVTGPVFLELQVGSGMVYDVDTVFAIASADYAYGDFTFGGGISYVDLGSGNPSTLGFNLGVAYQLQSFMNSELFAQYSYIYSDLYGYGHNRFEVGYRIPFGNGSSRPFDNPSLELRRAGIYLD